MDKNHEYYPEESIDSTKLQKEIKYSKRKLFLSAMIGALTGVVAYLLYENLDNETKENFTKQITKTLKNLIHNIFPPEE